MGKSGKLFSSLVNGVKALKSPSTREKSTKEHSHARKDRVSSVTKHGCMWSLGKSSSRNKSSVGVSLHPDVEVKDVQVQQLSGDSHPPASLFHYTDASLDEITSTLVDEIVREEPPPPHESYQEDWATILKLSDDESETEQCLTHSTQPEEQAAVMIQAAIRRYLVQQNFKRILEAVIRLQAVARGRMVRKQAATTLRCIHALVKFQANARGWLVRKSEVGQCVRQRLDEIRLQDPMLLEEEFQSKKQNHSRPIAFALDEQLCTKQSRPVMDFEPDEEQWGWAWLDRWMAARPWENSSSLVVKEKSRITAADDETESNNSVDEGAQIIVSNSEKQNESASCFQVHTSILSANMSALHEIPLPPPPPPLASYIQAANHEIKHPVLCATGESSESASLHTPPMTPVATKESSEVASLCAPPTTPTELAIPNITRECVPLFLEERSVFSTSVSSEVSSSTLAHAEEPEEIMPHGTPVDLGALQADVANPSIDESSPPASSFLQQSDSSSSSSFTMKEEDWRQDSTPAPLHIAVSEGEDSIDSAELRVNKTSVLNDEPVRLTNEEKTMIGTASEVSKHDDTFEKSTSGTGDVSILSNAEAQNIKAEAQETLENTKCDLLQDSNGMRESPKCDLLQDSNDIRESPKCDLLQDSNDMRESYVQVKGNGLHDTSATPTTLSEASVKQIGNILVKHEQREAVSQCLPSYMATTKSSKAKSRSQASPKPMPESPKQRLASPKHSSGSKRTPTSEGKGSFTNSRQIVHVRAGSKGQLASTIKDGSTSSSFRLLGDFKRQDK